MSITGLPGQGPVRVGIPVADLCAGLFAAQGDPDRAARARGLGRGPVGPDLAAAGPGVHARLPGGALAGRPRGAQAGRQQPPDQHPDRRVRDRGRPHQHRGRRPGRSGSASAQAIGHEELDERSGLRRRRPSARGTATRSMPSSPRSCAGCRARTGSTLLNEAGVPCGPINTIDQVFADPQVRHLGHGAAGALARARRHRAGRPADRHEPHAVPHPHAAAHHGRAHRGDPAGSRL